MGSRAWDSDGEQLRYNRIPFEAIRKGILRYGGTIRDITKLTLNSMDYDFQRQARDGMVVMGKGYSVATFFTPEEVVVSPERTVTGTPDGIDWEVWTPLIPGAMYRLYINGVGYDYQAKGIEVDDYLLTYIGNGRYFGQEDTGEPYCFGAYRKTMLSGFFTDNMSGDFTVSVAKLCHQATIPEEGASMISFKEFIYMLGYTCFGEIPAWDQFVRKVAEKVAEEGFETSSIAYEVRNEDATKYTFSASAVLGGVKTARDFFKIIYDNLPDEADQTMLTEWVLEDGAVYFVFHISLYSGLYKLDIPMIIGRA